MHVIKARNVNDAWSQAVSHMLQYGKAAESRAGKVLVAPWPVTTVYEKPCERVLFDPVRNANPFFHFMEALWMLSGLGDGRFLDRFITNFSKDFGELGGNIHGAYGYRWRHHFGFDQLTHIVDTLKKNPNDRQCVLTMWDPSALTQKNIGGEYIIGANDLKGTWKDRPCNTQAFFRVVEGALDMTVVCRSNDILWGAYGANAVHFSFLLEYMARRIGVHVGKMYQISNNWHAYEKTFRPYVEESEDTPPSYGLNFYEDSRAPMPIGNAWAGGVWDSDLTRFMIAAGSSGYTELTYGNTWFNTVAIPILLTHQAIKRSHYDVALAQIEECKAPDWKEACKAWINRVLTRRAYVVKGVLS